MRSWPSALVAALVIVVGGSACQRIRLVTGVTSFDAAGDVQTDARLVSDVASAPPEVSAEVPPEAAIPEVSPDLVAEAPDVARDLAPSPDISVDMAADVRMDMHMAAEEQVDTRAPMCGD